MRRRGGPLRVPWKALTGGDDERASGDLLLFMLNFLISFYSKKSGNALPWPPSFVGRPGAGFLLTWGPPPRATVSRGNREEKAKGKTLFAWSLLRILFVFLALLVTPRGTRVRYPLRPWLFSRETSSSPPDLLPTVRYVIRYAVREVGPGQLPPHLQGLPAEPAWALVKETTEVLPEGQRRLWVHELQPSQLQRVLRSQPVFQADFSTRPADVAADAAAAAGGSSRRRAHQHESEDPDFRGAAALERAVEKTRESTEQATAAARQAESAAAAAKTACIVATASAGVAAGAAAAAKARVTNMPPYTLEARVPDESLGRVPRA
ncbi:hypothetical protein Esti_004875 [Eimeria stiedai]